MNLKFSVVFKTGEYEITQNKNSINIIKKGRLWRPFFMKSHRNLVRFSLYVKSVLFLCRADG